MTPLEPPHRRQVGVLGAVASDGIHIFALVNGRERGRHRSAVARGVPACAPGCIAQAEKRPTRKPERRRAIRRPARRRSRPPACIASRGMDAHQSQQLGERVLPSTGRRLLVRQRRLTAGRRATTPCPRTRRAPKPGPHHGPTPRVVEAARVEGTCTACAPVGTGLPACKDPKKPGKRAVRCPLPSMGGPLLLVLTGPGPDAVAGRGGGRYVARSKTHHDRQP